MNKKRVVITGLGLISSIGDTVEAVTKSLYNGISGIAVNPSYVNKGLASQISGQLPDSLKVIGNRKMNNVKITRMMNPGAGYCFLSMEQALSDSQLPEDLISHPRTGMIIGTGGGSPISSIEVARTIDGSGIRKLSPFYSAKCMASSAVANLAVLFKIKGLSFSINSACATSAHAIGEAYEKIVHGHLDTVFCGGCDELDVNIAASFDRAGALSRHNTDPKRASRPYDKNRDGFVISGGGGVIILEERQQAIDRGAKIYAELIGYGATSDGHHMTEPSGEGAVRCMRQAIDCWPSMTTLGIDYINTHGTSTPAGDIVELKAIEKIFDLTRIMKKLSFISSTKSLTGHALGAAGVHELIYSIVMMENEFITGSANIENMDDGAKKFNIIQERLDASPRIIMSNSFGFGGTNVTLIIKKP
jgi:3-oxoacyl-[acyl-carrier-protein] synthase I